MRLVRREEMLLVATTHVVLPVAAMVSVASCCKGSVLEAGRFHWR